MSLGAVGFPPDNRVVAKVLPDGKVLLWLPGQSPRKSNQRKLKWVYRKGRKQPLITKSDNALAWVQLVVATTPDEVKLGLGSRENPLRVDVWCSYATNNSDLSIELVLDALEKAGVIANDRYVFEFHAHKVIDRSLLGVIALVQKTEEDPHAVEYSSVLKLLQTLTAPV